MAQTQAFLGEGVEGAIVKWGLSSTAALHLHPGKAQELIREHAERAIANVSGITPYRLPGGVTVELEFDHQSRADQAVLLPGVERAGERAISFRPSDGLAFIDLFRAACKLAAIRMSP